VTGELILQCKEIERDLGKERKPHAWEKRKARGEDLPTVKGAQKNSGGRKVNCVEKIRKQILDQGGEMWTRGITAEPLVEKKRHRSKRKGGGKALPATGTKGKKFGSFGEDKVSSHFRFSCISGKK